MAYPISNVSRRVQYTGSAGVGPYSFSFEILSNTDISVYKNQTLLTLTTDYTVTINANGTGSVTLVSAATGSDTITIYGSRALQRTSDFVTGGDLFANTLNDELDSLVIFTQQNKEEISRALMAPVTDPTTINMTLPGKSSRAGYVLSFNATTGNPEVTTTVDDINQASTYASSALTYLQTFQGQYYGSASSDPAIDPLGNACTTGDLFWSTTSQQMKVYNGSAWTSIPGQIRTTTIADATSITMNADTTDFAVQVNTQSAGTLTINAPTGTPINGQKLMLRLQATNLQTFSWNAAFAGSTDLALPTASSTGAKYDYIGFVYNSTASKWQMVAKMFGF
jgi:hypothetical protein